jgi:fatty acid desaturase (delta-4 desaturase)
MPITKRRNATPTSPKRSNRKKSTTIMNKKNNGKEFHGLVLTSAQLLEYPDLVAVDGNLYDLKGFAKVHPGGGQIRAAGAYDATALYHSMHPFSDPSKSKLFQKYKVGVHIPSEDDPKYNFNSAFAQDLKKTIRDAMGKDSWYAPFGFMLRTFYIIAAVLFFEYMWITTGNIWYGAALGFYHAQIGLCIQHDGSHGAISKNSIVNSSFAWLVDWIGASRWIWMEQHVLWHHPHTNHQLLDPDAQSAEPAIVFKDYTKEIPSSSNNNGKEKKETVTPLVAAQEWITHFILAMYGPSVVYNFKYLYTMRHNDYVPETVASGDFMATQRPITMAWRLFYLFRTVFLPYYIAGANIFASLFIVNFVVGICLTWVFVLSHNFEGSDRDPLKLAEGENNTSAGYGSKTNDNNNDANDICWYKMQVETSSSYGGNVAMFATGGLNFQIEHHVFPRLSSWHYPRVSGAVKKCCERHGVKYNYFPYIWDNTLSTLRYMRKVGVLAVMQHAREEF